jgi:fatty aldehyde-generating acyl-ACP reductase
LERFGFIVHPLDLHDLERKFPGAAKLPDSLLESAVRFAPPLVASHITGVRSLTGLEAEGWFIGLTLTPRLMVEKIPVDKVLKKIVAAGRKAADCGAKIVGLGAFTAVVGDAGVSVARQLDIAVTTGNTYTVATALQGLDYAAQAMGVDLKSLPVSVLGASGSIGKACARLLAARGLDVTLVARDVKKLEQTASLVREETGASVCVQTDLSAAVRSAGVIVAVTSAMEAVVDAADLQPGTIVCDVSRPRNVSKTVAEARRDVLVFEGGVVVVPGNVDFGMDFGFPRGTAYACMAETMILALEGRYEDYSLGRDLDPAKVKEISRLAEKHGFRLAGLRSFERAVPPERFAQVRAEAKKSRRASFV